MLSLLDQFAIDRRSKWRAQQTHRKVRAKNPKHDIQSPPTEAKSNWINVNTSPYIANEAILKLYTIIFTPFYARHVHNAQCAASFECTTFRSTSGQMRMDGLWNWILVDHKMIYFYYYSLIWQLHSFKLANRRMWGSCMVEMRPPRAVLVKHKKMKARGIGKVMRMTFWYSEKWVINIIVKIAISLGKIVSLFINHWVINVIRFSLLIDLIGRLW